MTWPLLSGQRSEQKMEPTGVEPVSARCDRAVIPLHYGPEKNTVVSRTEQAISPRSAGRESVNRIKTLMARQPSHGCIIEPLASHATKNRAYSLGCLLEPSPGKNRRSRSVTAQAVGSGTRLSPPGRCHEQNGSADTVRSAAGACSGPCRPGRSGRDIRYRG